MHKKIHYSKTVKLKYVHSYLSSRKMKFDTHQKYPMFSEIESNITPM